MPDRLVVTLVLGVLAMSCMPAAPVAPATTPSPPPTAAPPSPGGTPTPGGTATPPPTASPAAELTAPSSPMSAFATPFEGCVNGWIRPAAGDATYTEGLEILSGAMGLDGRLTAEEMLYFTGPEAPWIIEPRREVVERWYVKGGLQGDPKSRGRWLLEKRTEQILGVAAVAPYDSRGYESPDWTGFFGEGPPRSIEGLPGMWAGIPYDFVTGEGDTGQPGLPDEISSCLHDT